MPVIDTLQVTDDQIERFGTLIYDRTGIRISPQKKSLLSNRLRRRLKATDLDCFDKYFKLIQKLEANDPEWDAFLQEITTHETYLFRDESHWKWFNETFLPEIQSDARKGERAKKLRIWSAACSTGDEAYTIASCIANRLSDHPQWRIEIVGTDIGIDAVKRAQSATFSERSMKGVDTSLRRRYFSQLPGGEWTAKQTLKKWTSFRQHNLMEPLKTAPFDLVFLKNVMIYFDKSSKTKVIENIDQVLAPGGILLSGPAEGVTDLLRHYDRQSSWLHRKPAETLQPA